MERFLIILPGIRQVEQTHALRPVQVTLATIPTYGTHATWSRIYIQTQGWSRYNLFLNNFSE